MKPYTVQGNLICIDFGFEQAIEPEPMMECLIRHASEGAPILPASSEGTVTIPHDDAIIYFGPVIEPPSDCAS